MQISKIALAATLVIVFAAGFGIGLVVFEANGGKRAMRRVSVESTEGVSSEADVNEHEAPAVSAAERRRQKHRRQQRPDRERGSEGEREERALRTFSQVRETLAAALERGDIDGARRALWEPRIDPEMTFTQEEIAAWTDTLDGAPLEVMHELAAFLARTGGAAVVTGWVADAIDVPMEFRHRALHGMSHVPSEQRAVVAAELENLLVEGGLPHDLLRSAAHSYARAHVDEEAGKSGGFDALMGLLRDRPEVDARALLEATREFGTADDTDTLLGLLGEGSDWSRRETQSILNAVGTLAGRARNSDALLGLLRHPPESVSRTQIARMFSDAQSDLSPDVLRQALAATRGDSSAQEAIARGMARSGPAGVEALLEASRDPEVGLDPARLAWALNESNGREAIPTMVEMLGAHEEPHIVEPLARAIFENGGGGTVDSLLDQIGAAPSVERRRGIARALRHSSARVEPDRLLDLLEGSTDGEVSESLSRALVRSADPAHVLPRLHAMRAQETERELAHHIDRTIERLSQLARASERP